MSCVSFSPNNQYVVSGSSDSTLRVWDYINHTNVGWTGTELEIRRLVDLCLRRKWKVLDIGGALSFNIVLIRWCAAASTVAGWSSFLWTEWVFIT